MRQYRKQEKMFPKNSLRMLSFRMQSTFYMGLLLFL